MILIKQVDTRAYFTAATCAISLFKPLSVNTPSNFFLKKNLYINSNTNLLLKGSLNSHINLNYSFNSYSNNNVNNSTKLALWDKKLGVTSMYQNSKLTKQERDLIKITPRIRSILIGIILSDGWLRKRIGWNPRLGFKQSFPANFEYFWHVFNEISILCPNYPYNCKTTTRGKLFYALEIYTRQLGCLTEIYDLFYKVEGNKFIKSVKLDLYHYLDYLALAHWIMGSNNLKNGEIHLPLDGFSIEDKIKLIYILKIKYNINCILKPKGKSYQMCIPKKENKILYPTLIPYFYNFYKNENQKRFFQSSTTQLRLSNSERAEINLPQNLKDILIGLLLGDLHMQKLTQNGNPNLQFEQGLVHKDYIFHLYDLFKFYCNAEPKISDRKPDYRTGKVYTRVRFHSYYLPCFNELYSLFYLEGKNIPKNIGELLTPIGLAYWAMDDGNKKGNNNFIFNTNSYTLDEIELLKSVLLNKFNLDCSIQKHNKDKEQYRIYIKSKSILCFKKLVNPYFHDSMLYKLDFSKKA